MSDARVRVHAATHRVDGNAYVQRPGILAHDTRTVMTDVDREGYLEIVFLRIKKPQ